MPARFGAVLPYFSKGRALPAGASNPYSLGVCFVCDYERYSFLQLQLGDSAFVCCLFPVSSGEGGCSARGSIRFARLLLFRWCPSRVLGLALKLTPF